MALPVDIEGTWFNSVVSLDAGELRRADATLLAGDGSALGSRGGVVRHGDTSLAVTIDGSDVVTVQPGPVVIPGNAVSGTGPYRYALSSVTTGSITARNATNPRIDLVIARALDTDVVGAHAAYKGRIEVIAGTPGASPSVPSLPTMAVELARITVPNTGGGGASVDSTHRTYSTSPGGELVVPTFSMLPASSAKYDRARALDTGIRYEYNSGWLVVSDTIKVVKSADESVTSSTTLQNDNHLLFAAVAGATYIFEVFLLARSAASNVDIRVAFAFPTGVLAFGVLGLDSATAAGNIGSVQTTGTESATSGSTFVDVGASSTGATAMSIRGSFVCTTAGTVNLMWAQNLSSGNSITVRAGSWLRAERAV